MKSLTGLALLSVLMLKVCAFSISTFASFNLCAIEKSTEENKEKEEESFDKAKKKLLLYETSFISHEHSFCANQLPPQMHIDESQLGSFPVKNVPTPPPNLNA